jgi:hypothetical protein
VTTVTVLAVLFLVFSEPARLSGLAGFKPQYAIGGAAGAAVLVVSLVAVRPLGVAGRIAAGRWSAGDLGLVGPAGMVWRCRIDTGACCRCPAGRGQHATDHATLTPVDRRSVFRIATDAERADWAV